MGLDDLLDKVTGFFDLSADDLLRRGRRNRQAEARELFCFLAVRCLHHPGAKVALLLNMGAPSVSRAVQRGEKLVAARPEVGQWWEAQKKQ